jgi:hypothetical protein
MYGADEMLHGNDPTQGSELCSAVEMMYSFECMLPVTGDLYYADYLEKLAYNVLPTQTDDNFLHKQYYQQVNQVLITDSYHHFDCDYASGIVFGTTSGYPCCLSNMHQGWPKFIQNLWYATPDKGLAAIVYGPSSVKAKVAGGVEVEFIEKTDYPFSDRIEFTCKTQRAVKFPLHLRIPAWCSEGTISSTSGIIRKVKGGEVAIINREWNNDDVIILELPMEIKLSRWFEKSLGVERGPLVYALKVSENWKERKAAGRDDSFWEVFPASSWNFGIPAKIIDSLDFSFKSNGSVSVMPWNLHNAPVQILTQGRKIPDWQLYQNSAGKLPYPANPQRELSTPVEEIVLVPYGCTTIRIAEFPVVDVH